MKTVKMVHLSDLITNTDFRHMYVAATIVKGRVGVGAGARESRGGKR